MRFGKWLILLKHGKKENNLSVNRNLEKIVFLALMVAIDVVLSPILRIEGMAPMSSVVNIIAGLLMGPLYGTLMAVFCALIRMTFMGIPPLALTGAVFGALLAGWGARLAHSFWGSSLGEIIGTGLVGSLLSYPVMVWFTGSQQNLYWLIYTPRFVGVTLMGSAAAYLVYKRLEKIAMIQHIQKLFGGTINEKTRSIPQN